MKLLKIRIKRIASGGRTHYEYPPQYDAYKVIFGPIYESSLEVEAQKVRDRGTGDEYILIGVNDNDVAKFIEAHGYRDDKGFRYESIELSIAEAEVYGSQWTKQVEKITDQSRVISILAKIGRGETLTQKEKDALNPNNPELGINTTKSFSESLQEIVAIQNQKIIK